MSSERTEQCIGCGETTGRAGIQDDSNYMDNGDGPYCDECFSPRHIGELEDQRDEAQDAVCRAHAAIHWVATVRAAITSGALRCGVEDADHYRGMINILAVAHAASEVWLSRESVTPRAIADLLGWHAEHSEDAVREWLRPLQVGPHPPLVTEDGQPNIDIEGKK